MTEFSVGDRVLVPGVVEHIVDGRVLLRIDHGPRLARDADDLRPDTGGRDLTADEVSRAMQAWRTGRRTTDQVAEELTRIARGDAGSAGDDTTPAAAAESMVVGKAGVPIDAYDAIQLLAARADHPSRLLAEKARAVADWWNDPPGVLDRDAVEEAAPALAEAMWELLGGGPGDVSDARPAAGPRAADTAPTDQGDAEMQSVLNELRTECGDVGKILAYEFREQGHVWWTASRVYGVWPEEREIGSLPRNPAAGPRAGDTMCACGFPDAPYAHYPGDSGLTCDEHGTRAGDAESTAAAGRWVRGPHECPDGCEDCQATVDSLRSELDLIHDAEYRRSDRLRAERDTARSETAALRGAGQALADAAEHVLTDYRLTSTPPLSTTAARLERAVDAWRSAAGTPTTETGDGRG